MCGFGGIIHWKQKITTAKLTKVAALVAFRGPDHTGVKVYDPNFVRQQEEGEIGLFFNRLAILDLDQRSNQPFENERHLLVFNGEIYNHKALRAELEQRKVSFYTSSDTEVLFQALIAYGSAAIPKLNGMFAFVFFDKAERKLIAARDRTGIKPLTYLLDDKHFIFASETDSILRLAAEKPAVSQQAVRHYLSLQYIPAPATIWKNVCKLPPGCYLEESLDDLQRKNSIIPKTYWNAYDQLTPSHTSAKTLEELLYKSLESQLQSDVPLGLFLSSGIDSSVLAAMINKYFSKEKEVNFFTVAFPEASQSGVDEYKDAALFLRGFHNKNFVHHALHVDPASIQKELESMYHYLDEPFGDYAVMLNYVIAKKAKEHVTVVLSGDGSDELFWGYTRYNRWRQQQQGYRRHVAFWTKQLLPAPTRLARKGWRQRLTTDPVQGYVAHVSSGHFATDASFIEGGCWWNKNIDRIRGRKDLPSLIDVKTYLPDCMFYKVDRSSMGASLEVRVPFVDNDVIDFALQMQPENKFTGRFNTKAPVKELLSSLAPHYSFHLPKRGFSLPLKEWISGAWKEIVCAANVQRQLQSFDLQKEYTQLLQAHYTKKQDRSIELWRLLNLALWMETKERHSSV